MTDDLNLELRVGGTLRLEGPDGSVVTYTLKQIVAASGFSEKWTTTTPHSGRVYLTLSTEEHPRSGTWAQDSDGTPLISRGGPVIDVTQPD